MPAALTSERAVDREADELRDELAHLRTGITSLEEALGRAVRDGELSQAELAHHRAMLGEAHDVQAVLEHQIGELEQELLTTRARLGRQYLVSAIRGKLLADLEQTGWWGRRVALRRAARVERYLSLSAWRRI